MYDMPHFSLQDGITEMSTRTLIRYDAAYLELALREGLPLATLDKDLLRAARKSDVEIYFK